MPGMTPDEFAKFIGTLTGSAEAAALAKEVATDPVAAREKIHVPEDAGEYASDLEAILRRIPKGWFHAIDCGPGWYPLLSRLAKKLAEVDPDGLIEVYQVKEKFAELRVYIGADTLPCCRAVTDAYEAEHLEPGHPKLGEKPSEEYTAYWVQREAVLSAHYATDEHQALAATVEPRFKVVNALIDELEDESREICEDTGEPGIVMHSNRWLRTLDPVTAPDHYEIEEPDDKLADWELKIAGKDVEKLEATVRRLGREIAHQQVIIARLLAALRAERGRR